MAALQIESQRCEFLSGDLDRVNRTNRNGQPRYVPITMGARGRASHKSGIPPDIVSPDFPSLRAIRGQRRCESGTPPHPSEALRPYNIRGGS